MASDKQKSAKKSNASTRPTYMKRMLRNMWLIFVGGLVFAALFFLSLTYSDLPETSELENPTFEYATKIYTTDGEELGRYFRKNRDWVYPDQMNPHLVNALVATEDERFYYHSGIDYRGTMRAVVFMGKKGGASTITQQLARLLFHDKARSFLPRVLQKFKEWIISIRIEKRYTKEEIISMYLNKVDFLYDSDGVSAAAKTYFGKDQRDLEIQEAAMIVGMLKSPWIYNPKRSPERAKIRREVVLKQMMKNDFLSEEKYHEYRQLPLDMSKFTRQEDSEGLAPYFRTELTKYVKKLLREDEYKKPDGSRYNVYTDGLKIYTTIDSKMQGHAEAAVANNIKTVQKRYFEVWEGKDPWTYKTDDVTGNIRKETLNRIIQQTPQYNTIKDQYMSKIFADIKANIQDAQLRNVDIIRMLRQEDDAGYFAKITDANWATRSQVSAYKAIMNSTYWRPLKKEWKKMEKEVRVAFNEKRPIQVYNYETDGYKTMNITPIDSIKYLSKHMQSGMLAVEPSTGHVKAWVGGINHKVFQYDHVGSNRQVGSTFKPFIYATAIFMNGISPCWKVQDIQYSIPAKDKDFGLLKTWEPSNSDEFYREYYSLYEGLRKSKNSVSVYLMKELGNTEPVRNLANTMGVPKEKIPSAPSIALGTPELSLLDMTSAYSTFANNGIHNEPIFVTRIEDRNGQLIYTAVPEQSKALPEDYNYVMVSMLKYAATVISSKFTTEVGGKTGTTNDYVDGWFMGITPNLTVGTWTGGEYPWIRFRTIADGQGGKMARPAFVDFMERIEADGSIEFDETAKFKIPESMDVQIDCSLYADINDGDDDDDDDIEEDLFDDIEN